MIPISDTLLSRTTELRHRLHTCPESSGNEVRTAMLLKQFLSEYTSLELQDCGAGFYAAHREPDTAVPGIALRADYDPFPATVNDPACAEKVRSACNGTILPEPPCTGEVAYYDNAGVVCRCRHLSPTFAENVKMYQNIVRIILFVQIDICYILSNTDLLECCERGIL